MLRFESCNENPSGVSASPPYRRIPTPPPEVFEIRSKKRTYELYDSLIQKGGRPTAPINPDPGEIDPTDSQAPIHGLNHWTNEETRIEKELLFWKAFRRKQSQVRRSPEEFNAFKKSILEFSHEKELSWDLMLNIRADEQPLKTEWFEYYFYYHSEVLALKEERDHLEGLPEDIHDYFHTLYMAKIVQLKPFVAWVEKTLAEMGSGNDNLAPGSGQSQETTRAKSPTASLSRPAAPIRSKTTQQPIAPPLGPVNPSKVIKHSQRQKTHLAKSRRH